MRQKRIQVIFSDDKEGDIIDFLNSLKKQEVHIVVGNAVRKYMRDTGFYEAARYRRELTGAKSVPGDDSKDTDIGHEVYEAFASIEDDF